MGDLALVADQRSADDFGGGARLLVRNHVLVPVSDIAYARRDPRPVAPLRQ